MTIKTYDECKQLTADEEGQLWDRFYDLLQPDDQDRMLPEKRSDLEALIRSLPVVIEYETELCGLQPTETSTTVHQAGKSWSEPRFVWLSMQKLTDECCMSDEWGHEAFAEMQQL